MEDTVRVSNLISRTLSQIQNSQYGALHSVLANQRDRRVLPVGCEPAKDSSVGFEGVYSNPLRLVQVHHRTQICHSDRRRPVTAKTVKSVQNFSDLGLLSSPPMAQSLSGTHFLRFLWALRVCLGREISKSSYFHRGTYTIVAAAWMRAHLDAASGRGPTTPNPAQTPQTPAKPYIQQCSN